MSAAGYWHGAAERAKDNVNTRDRLLLKEPLFEFYLDDHLISAGDCRAVAVSAPRSTVLPGLWTSSNLMFGKTVSAFRLKPVRRLWVPSVPLVVLFVERCFTRYGFIIPGLGKGHQIVAAKYSGTLLVLSPELYHLWGTRMEEKWIASSGFCARLSLRWGMPFCRNSNG